MHLRTTLLAIAGKYSFYTDEHMFTAAKVRKDAADFVKYISGDKALLEANGIY